MVIDGIISYWCDIAVHTWYKYDIIVITQVRGEAKMSVNNYDIIQVNMVYCIAGFSREYFNLVV